MSHERIVIVAHDPGWVEEYERESARVRGALGDLVLAVEHIGSTAIPGLAAKPIVDIMVGVRSLADARSKVGVMEALGYLYVPEFEAQIPDRLFFQRGSPRTHHLHIVEKGSQFWARQLLFRDYVTTHPDVAQAYAELKQELAGRFAEDREGYTHAKTSFVEAVLAKAEAEAEA
jgi:GrpB-like predicted nucleotidyltransferase (UPF0157 family)